MCLLRNLSTDGQDGPPNIPTGWDFGKCYLTAWQNGVTGATCRQYHPSKSDKHWLDSIVFDSLDLHLEFPMKFHYKFLLFVHGSFSSIIVSKFVTPQMEPLWQWLPLQNLQSWLSWNRHFYSHELVRFTAARSTKSLKLSNGFPRELK